MSSNELRHVVDTNLQYKSNSVNAALDLYQRVTKWVFTEVSLYLCSVTKRLYLPFSTDFMFQWTVNKKHYQKPIIDLFFHWTSFSFFGCSSSERGLTLQLLPDGLERGRRCSVLCFHYRHTPAASEVLHRRRAAALQQGRGDTGTQNIHHSPSHVFEAVGTAGFHKPALQCLHRRAGGVNVTQHPLRALLPAGRLAVQRAEGRRRELLLIDLQQENTTWFIFIRCNSRSLWRHDKWS